MSYLNTQLECVPLGAAPRDFNPITFLNRKLAQLFAPFRGAIDNLPGLTTAQKTAIKDRPVDGFLVLLAPVESIVEDFVKTVTRILKLPDGKIKLPNGAVVDMNPRPASDNVFPTAERLAVQRIRMTLQFMLYSFYARPVAEVVLPVIVARHGIRDVNALMSKLRALPKPPGPPLPPAPTPAQVADMFRRLPGLGTLGFDPSGITEAAVGTAVTTLSGCAVALATATPPALTGATVGVAKIAADKADADKDREVRKQELENKAAENQATAAERAELQTLQAEIQAEVAAGADVPGAGMPSWVIPAAVGGVVLIGAGVFLLTRKK